LGVGLGYSRQGAICLAFVFAELSSKLPKDGSLHVYVTEDFGRKVGFFMAWVYWIISWSSNLIRFVTAVSYLCAITGKMSSIQVLAIEIFIVAIITRASILGVHFSKC
jgi:APA family basic amino acid/polyamine antiporter